MPIAVSKLIVETAILASDGNVILYEQIISSEVRLSPINQDVVSLERGHNWSHLVRDADCLDQANGRPLTPSKDVPGFVPELVDLVGL